MVRPRKNPGPRSERRGSPRHRPGIRCLLAHKSNSQRRLKEATRRFFNMQRNARTSGEEGRNESFNLDYKTHTDGLRVGKWRRLPRWGGGGKTIENMSDDARMWFWVCTHVAPLGRAPARVSTGYEYVCRYAFAYVPARARGGPFVFKVCWRAHSQRRGGG